MALLFPSCVNRLSGVPSLLAQGVIPWVRRKAIESWAPRPRPKGRKMGKPRISDELTVVPTLTKVSPLPGPLQGQ